MGNSEDRLMTNTDHKTLVYNTIHPNVKNAHNNTHVALVYGGMSAEREVTLMSAPGFQAALLDLGYKVTPIDMGHDIAEHLNKLRPDIVFNGLYGTYGEDGCFPGLLEILGIKYTHSGVMASAVGFNKEISFDVFSAHGFKITDYKIISKSEGIKKDPIPRPYVIKPISEGSSVGVEVVFDEDDFDFAKYPWHHGDRVIVQKYVRGRELQVAVFENRAIGILEIIPLKRRFYDYDTKYKDGMAKHVLSPSLPKDVEKEILSLSERAHNIIKCRNISRVEFLYEDGKGVEGIHILEINTHPGMTPLSIVPEICAGHGISYQDILNSLIQDGLKEKK